MSNLTLNPFYNVTPRNSLFLFLFRDDKGDSADGGSGCLKIKSSGSAPGCRSKRRYHDTLPMKIQTRLVKIKIPIQGYKK